MSAPTILLIPGFKGSILASAGRRVWISTTQALFGAASLAYDRPDLGVANPLRLTDGGILAEVPIIPGVFASNVYASTLRAITAAVPPSWTVRAWHYDWRDDPDALVAALDRQVAELAASGGEVRILAHSMGAMLAGAWLLRGSAATQHVSHAAFIAGAFRGTGKLFRNLQTGDDPTGRNRTLLSAAALGTMLSSYAFVPLDWPAAVEPSGAPVADDIRDPALWEREGWGLFRDGNAAVAPARRTFYAERFEASRRFLTRLADPAATAPASLRTFGALGVGLPTVHQVVRSPGAPFGRVTVAVDGDGTIPALSAELPPALAARTSAPIQRVPLDHMQVVQGGAALDAALRFLSG